MTEYDSYRVPETGIEYASILRRAGAFVYDLLLLFAILFCAAALIMIVLRIGIPVGHGTFQIYLLLIVFAFFGWFWVHGGQTLGMRAWRIRVQRDDGGNLDWKTAILRLVLGILLFVLGWLWCLWDPRKRALFDRLARTEVIVVPRGFVPRI